MSRSATQRQRPSRSLDATPVRALRGALWRRRSRARFARDAEAVSACSLAGRQRGRPRPAWGWRRGGMASTSRARTVPSFTCAAVEQAASGTPRRSATRWWCVPGVPRSTGFGPVAPPPCGRHAGRVGARATPVDPAGVRQALQEPPVQPAPHAGALPGPQAAPAGHPAAAAHLLRQVLPQDPGLQHEHDPGQAGPVGHPRAARLPRVLRPVGRHQRRHHRPQRVAHQRLGHTLGRARSGLSLLGILNVLVRGDAVVAGSGGC